MRITDDVVESLARLPQLESLTIASPRFTDAIWAGLGHLTGLKSLSLAHSSGIRGVGIGALASLQRLEKLDLGEPRLGDDAMPTVAARPLLDYLDLERSDLTDVGLDRLRPGRFLELRVSGTKVTRDAIERFRAARPTCRVISDFGTFAPD